ncbi:hypothetical protein HK096_007565 [Nowakowskiella sp. JEL0078]|nr:hypothetical protein HK096_007565 [Nowakowskiella sp. JEL0078]
MKQLKPSDAKHHGPVCIVRKPTLPVMTVALSIFTSMLILYKAGLGYDMYRWHP